MKLSTLFNAYTIVSYRREYTRQARYPKSGILIEQDALALRYQRLARLTRKLECRIVRELAFLEAQSSEASL